MINDEESKPLNLRTLHEAAEFMKLRPRTLAKAARRIGACSGFGRDLLFSDEDIRAVYEANRIAPSVRSTPAKPSLSDYQISKRLQQLTARPKRRGSNT